MAKIFEDFVGVAMREAMAPRGGRVSLQYPTHLDEQSLVPMRPDLVWLQGSRVLAVADAKYKAEKPSGFPQADLYQMLAYCTALGLRSGHLIYARGNELPAQHHVINSPVEITCHALDLDLPPTQLLLQIDQLAGMVTRSSVMAA